MSIQQQNNNFNIVNQKPDICIIGGGIVGLTSAYFLQKTNFFRKITILEKEKETGSRASFLNAGLLMYSRVNPLCEQFFDINSYIFQFMDLTWHNISNVVHFGVFAVQDYLKGIFDRKYYYERQKIFQEYSGLCQKEFWGILEREGISEADIGLQNGNNYMFRDKVLLQKKLQVLESEKQPYKIMDIPLKNNQHGFYEKMISYTKDYTASCWHFLTILQQKMEKKGNFEILTGKHVIELLKDEQNEKIVKGVKCDDGTILNSDYFVFCNNESIRDIVKYPLIRMCGFSWTFYKKDSQNQELIEEVSDCNSTIDTEQNIYYSIYHDRLRVTYGYFINPEYNSMKASYQSFIPKFPFWQGQLDKQAHNMSIGTRCVSPNGVPIVGLLNGFENAFVNTGHGFLGWTLSPYTGKLLSKIVIKQIDQEVQLDEQEQNILKHVSSERYWF